MNKITLLVACCVITLNAVFAQENKKNKLDFPALKERYMGQKLPGTSPKPFASGTVSTEKYLESGFAFSPDMTEICFTRKGGKYKKPTFIVMQYKNHKWSEKFIAPSDVATYKKRFIPTVAEMRKHAVFKDLPITGFTKSSKGTYYFYHIDFEKNGEGYMSYSRLINGSYETPIKMSKAINTGKYIAHPFIAPDESYLIWDAEMEGENTPDIYISYRQKDGSWGKGIRLGKQINTSRYEQYGKVTPDGKYFYFWKGDVKHSADGSRYVVGGPFWVDIQVIKNLKPME